MDPRAQRRWTVVLAIVMGVTLILSTVLPLILR
jgi:cytochrome c-type biogenesis protein CcmE